MAKTKTVLIRSASEQQGPDQEVSDQGRMLVPARVVDLPLSFAKPTGLIEIREPEGDGRLTLADRQLLNHLLAAAARHINTRERHVVHLADIRRYAADARGTEVEVDNRRLRASLRRLKTTVVEYDYLGNEGSKWGLSSLIEDVEIDTVTGTLEYGFSARMRKYLAEPALYSMISLRIQYQFDSKYGLALYEILRRYADRRANVPWWDVPVNALRTLIGCENKLTEWKDLRKRALDPAIDEINALSGFRVGMEEVRQGRGGKVVAVRFSIEEKDTAGVEAAARELDKPKAQRRGERKAKALDGTAARAIAWLEGADIRTRMRWERRAVEMGIALPPAATAAENLAAWVPTIASLIVQEEGLR